MEVSGQLHAPAAIALGKGKEGTHKKCNYSLSQAWQFATCYTWTEPDAKMNSVQSDGTSAPPPPHWQL
jgi:hypothetical protein